MKNFDRKASKKKSLPAPPPAAGGDALRYKLLLVDDEADDRRVFAELLERDGFSVMPCASAEEAFLFAVDSKPDLILTDAAMPEKDGLELCRRLKSDPRTSGIPLIIMSGVCNEEDQQLKGFEQGADDYLPKICPPRLLSAKIRALLRRYSSPLGLKDILAAEGLTLDVQARTVSSAGRKIALTRKEFDLLTLFLRMPAKVLNASYLLESVWGYDPAVYNDPRTLQVHVSSLRHKLGPKFSSRLVNLPGLGYRLDAARKP